ncbi:MAG: hypothetical protein F9K23_12905 [Bacteroidetes bacterium]|nr:MAG: hypothetical protein F9K23_12905 [Bacteroidota bacterium]
MIAQFEEKMYESYFNTELAALSDVYFPIGQAMEGLLGFDSAALSSNPILWHHFNILNPYSGISSREFERILNIELDSLHQIQANILFQYKRPEYIKKRNGKEWRHWNTPYYRYDIYKEQHDTLVKIHNELGNSVLVLYASPAIHLWDDLIDKHRNNQIIEFSNFQKCNQLNGHYKNTYLSAGNHSIACSDPREIEKINLKNELEAMRRNQNEFDVSNRDFIIESSKKIIEIAYQHPYLGKILKNVIEYDSERFINYPLINSFFMMTVLRRIFGIQWVIKL